MFQTGHQCPENMNIWVYKSGFLPNFLLDLLPEDIFKPFVPSSTMVHLPVLVANLLVGILSGLTVHVIVFSSKYTYRVLKQVIAWARLRQKMKQTELFEIYGALEELLGDFLEKYEDIVTKTPTMTRWEFFYMLTSDIFGIFKALLRIAFDKIFTSDEAPKT